MAAALTGHAEATAIARRTALIVVALVALRLVIAALTPLTFDEAYYWLWSRHLAPGYYDHPPMVALVIRAGTMLAGDSEFGVRFVSVMLGLPMSWALYRAAAMLLGDARLAATATLLLNATLIASAGTVIVTPDAPLLVASSLVLFCLAKVVTTGRGGWWIGVGLAAGAALLSKYTALFFGPVIVLWLVLTPTQRRWLRSPWLYGGGAVALACFAPVVLWNAQHGWMSFIKQLGRARIDGFHLRYVLEIVPAQIAFATPLVFALGIAGLYAVAARAPATAEARRLIGATVWVIAGYFAWHALHARVEPNWMAPVYPAFALAAALATVTPWPPSLQRVVAFCARWALPGGIALLVIVALQVNTGWLTAYRRDPGVRTVGVGFPEMAREIEAVRARIGATCVLSDDYGNTGWLAFYLPRGACVAQRTQRLRWTNAPDPDAAQLRGPLLLVGQDLAADLPALRAAFGAIDRVGVVERRRGPLVIETVVLDRLSDPKGDVFDRSPPPY